MGDFWLSVDRNAWHVGQKLLVEMLYMFVVRNMGIEDFHLATANTSTDITHAVVKAYSGVLIVRIGIAGLCGEPHNLVGLLCIAANQGTTQLVSKASFTYFCSQPSSLM